MSALLPSHCPKHSIEGCHVAIDTGSSEIAGPQHVIDHLSDKHAAERGGLFVSGLRKCGITGRVEPSITVSSDSRGWPFNETVLFRCAIVKVKGVSQLLLLKGRGVVFQNASKVKSKKGSAAPNNTLDAHDLSFSIPALCCTCWAIGSPFPASSSRS